MAPAAAMATMTGTLAIPPKADAANVKMFSGMHRFLLQRHSDIEWLRGLHVRKDKIRKESISECLRLLEHDSAERKDHVEKFGEEMRRHTNRKMDVLQRDLIEAEENEMKASHSSHGDRRKMQFQIDALARDIDTLRHGLCFVADAMSTVAPIQEDMVGRPPQHYRAP